MEEIKKKKKRSVQKLDESEINDIGGRGGGIHQLPLIIIIVVDHSRG